MRPTLFLSILLVLTASAVSAQAPPSESRIKADVREHIASNATEITIRGDGHRELNGGVYEYVRSITVRYPHSEVEGVEIEGYHDIVYQSHGSSYAYKDYRVGDWQYFGLPAPSGEEILALLDTNPVDAFPHETIDLPRSVEVIEGGTPKWHNLESVTVPVRMRYSDYDGNTKEFVDYVWDTKVRLYREDFGSPWASFLQGGFVSEAVEVGRRPGHEGVRTLEEAATVAEGEARAASLPQVTIPSFSSGREMATFLYSALRDAPDRATAEATLRAMLAPSYLRDGSETALTDWAQIEVVDPLIDGLYGGPSTFAAQFCPSPDIDEERTRRGGGRIYFLSVFDRPPRGNLMSWGMEVNSEQASGGYRNGQPIPGEWKISSLSVGLHSDPDDLAWLNSFDDTSSLCSASGRASQSATQGAGEATDRAAEGARGAVEGAVQEGRRRLGRVFGRRD